MNRYLVYYYAKIEGENTFNFTNLTTNFIVSKTNIRRIERRLERALNVPRVTVLSFKEVGE